MRARAFLILLSFLCVAPACKRPTAEECEHLCRRFGELSYFEEGRTAERQAGWEKLVQEPTYSRALDNCVTQCRFEGGTREMVACVDAAQSAREARVCLASESD